MYSEAGKRATMKYQKNNLDTITFRVPKGKREEYRNYAESIGLPLSTFIIKSIEEKMEKDNTNQ